MPIYLTSIHSVLRSKLYVMAIPFILLLLLSASDASAQITLGQIAIGEVNGAYPLNGATLNFHGYLVFIETRNQSYVPWVTYPPAERCAKNSAPLLPTYQWAQQVGAFLAINGSFGNPEPEFRPGDCRLVFGPVKSNGVIVSPIIPRPDKNGNPAILFARDGTATIKMATQTDVDAAFNVVSGQWEGSPNYINNGSLLLQNGQDLSATALPDVSAPDPRTAVGLTKDGILILVVIEGRLPGSDGITLPYLAQLLKKCGAVDAINLDGGGSSTMTYMPDPRVPLIESPALYNLMRSSQIDTGPFYFKFTQRDPRVAFASRPSDLIPPSDKTALNLLYRPVTIHFGFVYKQAPRR